MRVNGRELDRVALTVALPALWITTVWLAWDPLVVLVIGVVGALGLAAAARRSAPITAILLGAEVRERIALTAAEKERARLSREIHDDPLQTLAGVIQRLACRADVERELVDLRTVATRLREIATELHPPVLDDLGLVPALESLARHDEALDVQVVVDGSGYQAATRPPQDVEIAAYRIVREAVTNAVAHSGTSIVTVLGRVDADVVLLSVVDRGGGFRAPDVDRAMRTGHIGVASMRRRAEAIHAALDVQSGVGAGTTVTLRWSA